MDVLHFIYNKSKSILLNDTYDTSWTNPDFTGPYIAVGDAMDEYDYEEVITKAALA